MEKTSYFAYLFALCEKSNKNLWMLQMKPSQVNTSNLLEVYYPTSNIQK